MDQKPYVVSEDIQSLLGVWATEKGFILPPNGFFIKLREKFITFMKQIFENFEFIKEEEISGKIVKIVAKSDLYPISLEKVYFPTNPSLEICRHTSFDKKNKGLGPRANTKSFEEQIKSLESVKNYPILLIDDVIFTGEVLLKVVKGLLAEGFRVETVCAGIGIEKGIQELEKEGLKVHCIHTYQEVIDEICERDFYPGVPLSGRLFDGKQNIGIPYILPFGKPVEWASIPQEWQIPFSIFCIQQTITLFRAIEYCSKRIVLCEDLERKVYSLPIDGTGFVKALYRALLYRIL